MNCIFCLQEASEAKSIEHIMPESLGNKNHILPKGVVCDKCNNYFAIKIEKKVLEMDFFRSLRHRNGIQSKKRKIPNGIAEIPGSEKKIDVKFNIDGKDLEFNLDKESFENFKKGHFRKVIVRNLGISDFPRNDQMISRFLAKVALELMALRVLSSNRNEQNIFAKEEALNPIRNYVRYNHKEENWVYNVRKIYEENDLVLNDNNEYVDMLFEMEFLATNEGEMYFVIAIKGIELVINIAGSSVDGYKNWLKNNNDISPLDINRGQKKLNFHKDISDKSILKMYNTFYGMNASKK